VTVTGKHGSGTVNAYGTGCQQYPNNNLTKILGGWGISDSPAPTNLTGGWGTLIGSTSSKNTVKFQLTGWLE